MRIKEAIHPNACLKYVRNMQSGLRKRSIILEILEGGPSDAAKIAEKAGVSYAAILHHLRLLKNEGIVERRGHRPFLWLSSGLGQKRLG